jgi:hypothetical protein
MNQKFAFILDNKVEMVMEMDELLTSFFNADYHVEDRTEEKRIFGPRTKFYLDISSEGLGSQVVMMNEDFYSLLLSNPIAVAISDESLVSEGWTYDGSEFFEPTEV